MPQKRKNTRDKKVGKVPISASATTLTEKPKRGRPTIPENFLLGIRNAWITLLEESWPEIGWNLLSIRDRRNSTIEDIRKTFEPAKEKIHNPGLATAFHHESTERAKPSGIIKNRQHVGKLDAEIHDVEAQREACQRSCQEVEAALKVANSSDIATIQAEGSRRQQLLFQLENNLGRLRRERDVLYKRTLDQEAYLFRSELLDFLSSGRYAINPRNLANALAGLPGMRWRQSYTRCSRMSYDNDARPEYRVFEVVSDIWNRRSQEFETPPIDFFRSELVKHTKRFGYTRQFIGKRWSDMKLAIVECWNSEQVPSSIPSVITVNFMRNIMRQKNAAEQILADQESLEA